MYKSGKVSARPFKKRIELPRLGIERVLKGDRVAVLSVERDLSARYASVVPFSGFTDYYHRCREFLVPDVDKYASDILYGTVHMPEWLRREADIGENYTAVYNIDHIEIWDSMVFHTVVERPNWSDQVSNIWL